MECHNDVTSSAIITSRATIRANATPVELRSVVLSPVSLCFVMVNVEDINVVNETL